MISRADFPSIARQVRSGTLSVDLDDASIVPPNGEPIPLAAPIKITLDDGDFCCIVRRPPGFEFPESLRGYFQVWGRGPKIVGLEHCLSITGTTPDGLDLELRHVWPMPTRSHSKYGASTYFEFSFNKIVLPIKPPDPEALAAQLRLLGGFFERSEPESAAEREKDANPEPRRDDVMAIVPGVRLFIRKDTIPSVTNHPFFGESSSSEDCFMGKVFGGTFCLEERDGDVTIIYRRDTSPEIEDVVPAKKVMDGLLDALKFTHSCQPWPYYYERQENHRIVERWVGTSDPCHRDTFKPLSQADFDLSDDGAKLFICAAEYFAVENESAARASRALWLMHDACRAGTPGEIRLISLCSIIEGLISAAGKKHLSPEELKLTRKERWQLLMERLDLPWKDVFDRVLEDWNFYRHPLAHGFQAKADESPDRYFKAYSRFSAAIYILIAQEMGYQGDLDASLLENSSSVKINRPRSYN